MHCSCLLFTSPNSLTSNRSKIVFATSLLRPWAMGPFRWCTQTNRNCLSAIDSWIEPHSRSESQRIKPIDPWQFWERFRMTRSAQWEERVKLIRYTIGKQDGHPLFGCTVQLCWQWHRFTVCILCLSDPRWFIVDEHVLTHTIWQIVKILSGTTPSWVLSDPHNSQRACMSRAHKI